MRLLYLEDQIDSAQIVKEELHDCGFAVDHASTIEDADYIEALTRYDALLLDQNLPDGDGLTWLKSMRDRGKTTPAILLTAFCDGPHDVANAQGRFWICTLGILNISVRVCSWIRKLKSPGF